MMKVLIILLLFVSTVFGQSELGTVEIYQEKRTVKLLPEGLILSSVAWMDTIGGKSYSEKSFIKRWNKAHKGDSFKVLRDSLGIEPTLMNKNIYKKTRKGYKFRKEITKSINIFISRYFLDQKALKELQDYLKQHENFKEFKDKYERINSWKYLDYSTMEVITIMTSSYHNRYYPRYVIRQDTEECVFIKVITDNSEGGVPELNKLVELMNNLIPPKYKKYYSLYEYPTSKKD